jgi:hypothetical protein
VLAILIHGSDALLSDRTETRPRYHTTRQTLGEPMYCPLIWGSFHHESYYCRRCHHPIPVLREIVIPDVFGFLRRSGILVRIFLQRRLQRAPEPSLRHGEKADNPELADRYRYGCDPNWSGFCEVIVIERLLHHRGRVCQFPEM